MADKTADEIAADAATTKPDAVKPTADTPAAPNANADANADVTATKALSAANKTTVDAVAALLKVTRDAHPSIPSSLIVGDSAESIAASVTSAEATVKDVIAANPPAVAGGSAGSPPRELGPEKPPEGLSPTSRIAWALNHPGPGSTTDPAKE